MTTLLRWTRRVVLAGLALVIVIVAAGVAYEQGARWSAVRDHPPVGELVEVKGRQLHLHCTGDGQPTVILESGLSVGGSLDWTLVQPGIARLSRVCSYDRAGVLWSDRGRAPRDANRIATELHALLSAAGESPPYVMVGHSLGGPFVRVFAHRYQGEVVGFVFVDSSHPEQEARFQAEVPEYPYDPRWASVGTVETMTGVYRLRTKPLTLGLSDEVNEPVKRLQPKTVAALAAEVSAMDETMRQAAEAGTVADQPLVVLTAGRHGRRDVSQVTMVKVKRVWLDLQNELASLSTNSAQRTIEDAHHYIQLANPEAVVTAVRDVLTAVRASSSLAGQGGHE